MKNRKKLNLCGDGWKQVNPTFDLTNLGGCLLPRQVQLGQDLKLNISDNLEEPSESKIRRYVLLLKLAGCLVENLLDKHQVFMFCLFSTIKL